jgi:hypothetical protein
MVATLVLGTSAVRRVGSSPTLGTKYCDAGVASVSWAELGRPPLKVRVLQSQQRVVPLRKELTISRIIDNPSEMMTNWVLPNNTEVLNLTFGVVAQQVEQ